MKEMILIRESVFFICSGKFSYHVTGLGKFESMHNVWDVPTKVLFVFKYFPILNVFSIDLNRLTN
jgi:hypothetical protein